MATKQCSQQKNYKVFKTYFVASDWSTSGSGGAVRLRVAALLGHSEIQMNYSDKGHLVVMNAHWYLNLPAFGDSDMPDWYKDFVHDFRYQII